MELKSDVDGRTKGARMAALLVVRRRPDSIALLSFDNAYFFSPANARRVGCSA